MANKSFNPILRLAQVGFVLIFVFAMGAGNVMADNENTPITVFSTHPLTLDEENTVKSVVRNQLLIPSKYSCSQAIVSVDYNSDNEPEELIVELILSNSFETITIKINKSFEAINQNTSAELLPDEQPHYSTEEEEKIAEVVRKELILPSEDPYLNAKIRVKSTAHYGPDELLVYLQRRDVYEYETARIELDEDYDPIAVEKDYDEEVPTGTDETYDCSCPDPSVEMVFATPCPEFQTAIEAVDRAYEVATQAGYKCKKLIGSEANVQAYKNWLSCDNLKAFGNIGHGSPDGIMLDDGPLFYSWFDNLSESELNCQVMYFNSCQVHNPPLETSIMDAGARTFIGGNVNLWVGSSEEVFKCFWENVLDQSRLELMEQTLSRCEGSNYPDAGAHGFSGDIGAFKSATLVGRVTDESGSGISGVALSGLPGNPVTEADGYYIIPVDCEWSGTVTPQKSGYSFTPESRSYSDITFEQTDQNYSGIIQKHPLTVITTGAGTVTSTPSGISCEDDCSESYDEGTVVTLTAEPENVCSILDNWVGCDNVVNGECLVTMDAAKSVTANFKHKTYPVTATAGPGGSISPSGNLSVACRGDRIFRITSDTGYKIANIMVNGDPVEHGSSTASVNLIDIYKSYTIEATFEKKSYTITAITGSGGSISPADEVRVEHAANQEFAISPDEGYKVEDIIVDGVSVGSVNSYLFQDVTEDHTIEATFEKKSYTITATADSGGSISPAGEVRVQHAANQEFVINPDEGYNVEDVVVDGVSVGNVNSYLFPDVTEDHSIDVVFSSACACKETPTIQSVRSGDWNDPTTWNTKRVPESNDVVQIRDGHTLIAGPCLQNGHTLLQIKALCNCGTLKMQGNKNILVAYLKATDFIQNYGNIFGQDGKDGSGTTVPNYVHATPGHSIYLKSKNFYNHEDGKIKGGRGGHDITHDSFTRKSILAIGADGGSITILADDTILNYGIIGPEEAHTYSNKRVFSDGGNGGIGSGSYKIVDCSTHVANPDLELGQGFNYGVRDKSRSKKKAAIGGNGGDTVVRANKVLTNESTGRISSGYGADARAWSCSYYIEKGIGGELNVRSKGQLNQRGVLTGGGDGRVLAEPEIMMSGSDMHITDAREVVLFGGDDWLLDLRNLRPNAIEATKRIILAVGEGGTIDLRDNAAKVMNAGIEVQIFADEVLLDEGISLEDLVDSPNIEKNPSRILYEASLSLIGENMGQADSTLSLQLGIVNSGPTDDTYTLNVTDSKGWTLRGLPSSLTVEGLSEKTASLKVTLPSTPGAKNEITVTATSNSEPDTVAEASARIIVEPSSGPDSDGDDVADDQDAFPEDSTEWMDSDNDGVGDNADLDDDNDGMTDEWENVNGLNPFVDNVMEDPDEDGFTNIEEYEADTDPTDPESHPDEYTAGIFTVDENGQVRVDYLFDGGAYQGELGLFSLSDMEGMEFGSAEFVSEAVGRVLSDSILGAVVIQDSQEGARFSGQLGSRQEPDFNLDAGKYRGIKTVEMTPGDKLAAVLIPNGTFAELAQNPSLSDPKKQPLFSLATANPQDGLFYGQVAGVNPQGCEFANAVAFEDMCAADSDRDYNDVVFQIRGVEVYSPTLDGLIAEGQMDPADDWRVTEEEGIGDHLCVPAPDPDTPWLTFILKSPADLLVYDPEGRVIGKDGGEIPGATFKWDENGHQVITVPSLESGEYTIVLRAIGDGGLCHLEVRGFEGDTEIMTQEKPLVIEPHQVLKTTVDATAFAEYGEIRFETPQPSVCGGKTLRFDYDGDGDIDEADIARVSELWGICEGDARYDSFYDLDDSGCIDFYDVTAVANAYYAGQ